MVSTSPLDISNNPPGSEVFIGLVGPVGVNLNSFSSLLETSLKRLEYLCVPVKLSRWISKHSKIDDSNDSSKLKGLMEEGSRCRRVSGRGDFPLADVFFNEKDGELGRSIDRFVETIFSNPFHTPTKDEQGMQLARNAALRSADLARQIGAAITTTRGEVISIGCNEAARAGGGQYWADDRDIEDKRDFNLGFDSNDKAKVKILTDLLEKIEAAGALNGDVGQIVADAVAKKSKLSDALLFDVIEYFRSVHAEMAALMDAARRGIDVKGCTMYATTFPCHECAKHIVAAGIKRVVYIEPYPKSKALELFNDAIAMDQTEDLRTTFESFVGIAPRRYSDLFELGSLERKDSSGKRINWNYKKGRLRKPELETTYSVKEMYYRDLFLTASESVAEKLKQPRS